MTLPFPGVYEVVVLRHSSSTTLTCAALVAFDMACSTLCISLCILVLAKSVAYDGLPIMARLQRAMVLHCVADTGGVV